jgi:2,3-bisphosphoglycerate-dependent phosphoglycerate mutase
MSAKPLHHYVTTSLRQRTRTRSSMELVIARHALPVKIVDAQGPADPQLSERGLAQAEKLANYLAEERFDAIWVSPMRRALETAAPLAAKLGLTPIVDDRLAEWDRDSSSYIPVEELKATNDPIWQSMAKGEWHGSMDPVVFKTGVIEAFEKIIGAHSGQRVAIVCHGGVIGAYLASVLGLPETVASFFHPEYTSIHRVMAAKSGERSMRCINEIAHLRGSGLLA